MLGKVHEREGGAIAVPGKTSEPRLSVLNEATAAGTLIDGAPAGIGKDPVFRRAWRGGGLRLTIAFKIFSIVVGLLILMSAAALLSLKG